MSYELRKNFHKVVNFNRTKFIVILLLLGSVVGDYEFHKDFYPMWLVIESVDSISRDERGSP